MLKFSYSVVKKGPYWYVEYKEEGNEKPGATPYITNIYSNKFYHKAKERFNAIKQSISMQYFEVNYLTHDNAEYIPREEKFQELFTNTDK